MIYGLILLSLLVVGCSSHIELKKLAVNVDTIPIKSREEAVSYLFQQKKYYELLNSDNSNLPEYCRFGSGEIKDTKDQLSLMSLIRVDRTGRAIVCPGDHGSSSLWEIFYMCPGELRITRLKILKDHVADPKVISLCE